MLLAPLPPITSPPPSHIAIANNDEDQVNRDVLHVTTGYLLTSSSSPELSQQCSLVERNEEEWGEDLLSGHINLLNQTLSSTSREDMDEISKTAVPLASTLLDISEKQKDPAKTLRSHQVLCEVASMGLWSVSSSELKTK